MAQKQITLYVAGFDDRRIVDQDGQPVTIEEARRLWEAGQHADPAVRRKIEAMKILVMKLIEDAGYRGMTVGELKQRLGIPVEDMDTRLPGHGGPQPRETHMTAEDLWNEYRERACPPHLNEPDASLYWQRWAFLAGVVATLESIAVRPSCFEELRQSLASLSDELDAALSEMSVDTMDSERSEP